MEDFTALISQFSRWLQAHNLDPKEYSLTIVAQDPRALDALRDELDASLERGRWRPAWGRGGVEIDGIAIETRLRDSAEAKPREKESAATGLPAAIFWPLAIAQIAFFAWLIFSSVAWWRL
jgi:hypothetical protein